MSSSLVAKQSWSDRSRQEQAPWHYEESDDDFLRWYTEEKHRHAWNSPLRCLVPFSGNNPVTQFLFSEGHNVTVLDVLPATLQDLRADIVTSGSAEDGKRLTLVGTDIFHFHPAKAEFDLIYDRGSLVTFSPKMRGLNAALLSTMLAKNGLLFIASFFFPPIDHHEAPFAVSLSEIKHLFPRLRVLDTAEQLTPTDDERIHAVGIDMVERRWTLLQKH